MNLMLLYVTPLITEILSSFFCSCTSEICADPPS